MPKDVSISYMSKILIILHPQPDLTRRQLLYMAAKKKYNYSVSIFFYMFVLATFY